MTQDQRATGDLDTRVNSHNTADHRRSAWSRTVSTMGGASTRVCARARLCVCACRATGGGLLSRSKVGGVREVGQRFDCKHEGEA